VRSAQQRVEIEFEPPAADRTSENNAYDNHRVDTLQARPPVESGKGKFMTRFPGACALLSIQSMGRKLSWRKCKSCGTQVALGAIVCPNCGELNPGIRYGGVLPELFGVIAVLTVAVMAFVAIFGADLPCGVLKEDPDGSGGRPYFVIGPRAESPNSPYVPASFA
jgi:hypothetical protein